MIRFLTMLAATCFKLTVFIASSRADTPFSLQVNDKATGEPLSGVAVTIGTENSNQKFKTDDAGHVEVTIPGNAPRYFSVMAKLDHYAPVYVSWGSRNNARGNSNNNNAAVNIPQTFSITMEPGTRIGGVIKDEKGQAVPDATVRLQSFDNGNVQSGVPVNKIDATAKTDAQGKWSIDTAPAKIPPTWMMVEHKDFHNDQVWHNAPPEAELHARTAVTTIEHAQTLTGKVVDPDGKPVANAAIAAGEEGWGGPMHKAKTNADGTFALKGMRPGQALISVYAKGFAPDTATLSAPSTQPAQIQLHPGTPLEFHVQDPKGNPLQGVKISVHQWRNVDLLQFQMQTDANGVAIWKDAPSEELHFNFNKQNWGTILDRKIAPATQPVTVTLGPQTKVHGTVVDAATSQPIKSFKVTQGIGWENSDTTDWVDSNYGQQYASKTGADGSFTITPGQSYPLQFLRIQADGYAPIVSRALKSDEGEIDLEFKMTKAVPMTGTLHTPDGKSLPDVTVLMVTGRTNVQIQNGNVTYPRPEDSNSTHTDSAGHFSFNRETGAFLIVASSPDGIAQYQWSPGSNASKSATSQPANPIDLTFQPWGRIEGTIKVAGKPGAGEAVVARPLNAMFTPGQPSVFTNTEASADAKGHFVIPMVLPGVNTVARQNRSIEGGRVYYLSSRGETVAVEPGKTANVEIGNKGRPVIGRFEIPKDLADRQWHARGQITSPMKIKPPSPPSKVQAAGQSAYIKWVQDWQKSDEGKAFMEQQTKAKYFPVVVNADGTFRAEEVTPGTYELHVFFTDTTGSARSGFPRFTGSSEFTVPEIPGGYTDQPLDFGLVQLKSPATRSTAATAPGRFNRAGG